MTPTMNDEKINVTTPIVEWLFIILLCSYNIIRGTTHYNPVLSRPLKCYSGLDSFKLLV